MLFLLLNYRVVTKPHTLTDRPRKRAVVVYDGVAQRGAQPGDVAAAGSMADGTADLVPGEPQRVDGVNESVAEGGHGRLFFLALKRASAASISCACFHVVP